MDRGYVNILTTGNQNAGMVATLIVRTSAVQQSVAQVHTSYTALISNLALTINASLHVGKSSLINALIYSLGCTVALRKVVPEQQVGVGGFRPWVGQLDAASCS